MVEPQFLTSWCVLKSKLGMTLGLNCLKRALNTAVRVVLGSSFWG